MKVPILSDAINLLTYLLTYLLYYREFEKVRNYEIWTASYSCIQFV